MRPNPRLFLEGMKSFCDEIHSKGLRCGLYTGFAPMVCGFQNGSWGYETIDANTFASWGVDLVKNDWSGATTMGIRSSSRPQQRFAR